MNEEIDKLAWIYIKDKHLLTTRSRGKDICYIPGGKREHGECDHDALVREIKEELCVDIAPATIKPAGVFTAQAHGKADGVLVKMTCYFAEYTGAMCADNEIEEVVWLDYKNKERASGVAQLIMEWLKTKSLIE